MLVMVTDKDGAFTGRVVTLRTNKETAMFHLGQSHFGLIKATARFQLEKGEVRSRVAENR